MWFSGGDSPREIAALAEPLSVGYLLDSIAQLMHSGVTSVTENDFVDVRFARSIEADVANH